MTIYQDQGYESREAYLRMLAENYDLTYASVVAIADTLGEGEDFDGLLCALEDAAAAADDYEEEDEEEDDE